MATASGAFPPSENGEDRTVPGRLEGTVAAVTGAGSGMGREMVRALVATGGHVAALDVNEVALKDVSAAFPPTRAFVCDVSDLDQVASVFSKIESELGPVDRLVNAAGIGVGGRLEAMELGKLRKAMQVNYLGTAHCVAQVIGSMRRRGRGEIINFASIAGWIPTVGMGAYCASKFALVAYTEVLARELEGTGIRILCVCPPSVRTPLLDDLVREGAVSEKGLKLMRPLTPVEVLDGIEKALHQRKLFHFPGRGTAMLWRLRRFAPRLMWSLARSLSS